MKKKHSSQLKDIGKKFFTESVKSDYSYNFEWLSRPIIQYPQDIVAVQEIIWKIKPDLVIETGIAHGGSLILSASMLTLLDYSEAKDQGNLIDPRCPKRKVIGIDVDIREHNRKALDDHSLRNRLILIEGSSISESVIKHVTELTKEYNKVMVFLDSNHTHQHVLAELKAYAPLVTSGSYCVVFDSVIEDLPTELCEDKQWGVGDNPKTAVREFLQTNPEFYVDIDIENKLIITVAPSGYLKRI